MAGRPKGVKNKRSQHKWSEEEKEYLKTIAKGRGYKEIVKMMSSKFEYEFTENQVARALNRYKIRTGVQTKFKKGSIPWNKGLKGYTSRNSTSFEKGNIPPQYRPVGSERINKEGYIEIKVADPGKWRLKHRVIWEKHNGEIPKNHTVIFADRDKSNLDIDNLLLVSRSQLLMMNRNNLIKDEIELTKVGANIANVLIKVSEVKNK